MGNVDRLLDALAKQLPHTAPRAEVLEALRAAAGALPESKAKLRLRILRTENDCVQQILERLQEAADAAADDDDAEPFKVDGEGGSAAPSCDAAAAASSKTVVAASTTAYADLDADDVAACMTRCSQLLCDALASARPAARAVETLDGLLALVGVAPRDDDGGAAADFDVEVLALCCRLVPLAGAAIGGGAAPRDAGPMVWRRFLAFLLLAPARLPETTERAGSGSAAHLGGVLALAASPAAARGALRLAFEGLPSGLSGAALARLGFAMLPAAAIAFGAGTATDGAACRGGLLAAMHSVRLASLCRAHGVGHTATVQRVQNTLRATIAVTFDLTPVIPELRKIAAKVKGHRGAELVRRLRDGSGVERSRAASASATVDVLDAAAGFLKASSIARLVDLAGLPPGDGEAHVVDAAAARARLEGALFFEDTAGLGGAARQTARGDVPLGITAANLAAVAATASSRSLEAIGGVEALRAATKTADRAEEEAAMPAKKRTRTATEAAESPELSPEPGRALANALLMDALGEDAGLPSGAAAEAEAAAADEATPKRLRRRRKSAPGPLASNASPVASP